MKKKVKFSSLKPGSTCKRNNARYVIDGTGMSVRLTNGRLDELSPDTLVTPIKLGELT